MLCKCTTRLQKCSEMFFKVLRHKNGLNRRKFEKKLWFLGHCLAHLSAELMCLRNTQKNKKKVDQ